MFPFKKYCIQRNRSGSTKSKQCGYCGRSCKSKETCPAKGQKCLNCGKMDHFAIHYTSTQQLSQSRKVAIHLQDAVAKELQKQVYEGILEPVDSTMGPTTWISNPEVVRKNDPDK
ncbi:unnamed protein product [Brachionus calyciflorus]|uniref:Uncharacterized protein n=1 Tax=Brachionus calyciflorus TaxID=104777 RepID=A0A814NQ77_9BILA|nr:unnamed protein product [Brachionus calyciflorus]